MIWPGPPVAWTTTVDAPAVVAGVAVVKVMLPVWLLSPMVTVPLAVVWIWASSASVRLMPATALFVPPRLIGRRGSDERMTTPPAVGLPMLAGANSLTVVPDVCRHVGHVEVAAGVEGQGRWARSAR